MTRARRNFAKWLGLGLAVGAALWVGCSSEESASVPLPTGGSGGAGNSGNQGGSAASAGAGGNLFEEHGDVVSVAVDPPLATIDVVNAQPASASFTAVATFQDQFQSPVAANWTFNRPDIALVDKSSGVVTAHGVLGGQGTLTAAVGQITGTGIARVVLHLETNTAGLSPADIAKFDAPDPQASGTLLYPYDGTVFARDILAPEIMWSGAVDGDVAYVHLAEQFFDAKFYVPITAPGRFLMSETEWTQLSKSNAGESVQVDVSRLAGGVAYTAMHQGWSVAQGSLRGTIYYWAASMGTSMRLKPGSDTPEVVFDTGLYTELGSPAPAGYDNTLPPWSPGTGGKRCVSCHTVSKNGERLAGVFERKQIPWSPWGTVDLTTDPPSILQIQPYSTETLFIALTHDGSFAVQNDRNFTLHLRDATTGAAIASDIDSYTAVADPSFSGDPTMLAFSSNVTGAYPVEFTRADLDVVDFDPGTKAFSNRRQIVAAGSAAIAFPSFSPDSKWIFYQKGDYSRANQWGSFGVGHNDLYMADVAKAVGEIQLNTANGAGYLDAKNLHLNYQPNINPIAVGGYYWVVFFSPRDYGNRMASATNPSYENRKQLWVAAVDINPQPGQDPSHPAFWLRGQDLTTINMKGYWVLEPCRQEGNACNAGYECCTGFCQPDADNNFLCSPPASCAGVGEACQVAGDCCDSEVECVGGFCALLPPQ